MAAATAGAMASAIRRTVAVSAVPREAAALLGMPVLAMTGAHDTLWRRECARVLATLAPRARHLEIPAAGHLSNADNPAAFNAAVAQFLQPKASA